MFLDFGHTGAASMALKMRTFPSLSCSLSSLNESVLILLNLHDEVSLSSAASSSCFPVTMETDNSQRFTADDEGNL